MVSQINTISLMDIHVCNVPAGDTIKIEDMLVDPVGGRGKLRPVEGEKNSNGKSNKYYQFDGYLCVLCACR